MQQTERQEQQRELNSRVERTHGAPVGRNRIAAVIVVALLAGLQCSRPAEAATVPVRFQEGSIHGFLVLRNAADSVLAHGDLLQTAEGMSIQSRMVFRFTDGSHFEERVHFTQSGVFQMQSYNLEMRGATFPHDQKISMQRETGEYRVETTPRGGEGAEVHEGTMELPTDVYNGMIITVAKNLTSQSLTRVHYVAFMPEPRLIELDLAVGASATVMLGTESRSAAHFAIKPQLGGLTQFFAKLLGKLPPDNHVWIMTGDVPAFVKSVGALYMDGPEWRIELAVPRWP
jgi:hypothetical protein